MVMTKYSLLTLLALIFCLGLAESLDANERVLQRLIRGNVTFLSADNYSAYNISAVNLTTNTHHVASGYMRDEFLRNITFLVPKRKPFSQTMLEERSKSLRIIYEAMKAKHGCSKHDMLVWYSIPFGFDAVIHAGIRLYPMPTFTTVTEGIEKSEWKNNQTGRSMLAPGDVLECAQQLATALTALHDVGYQLGAIQLKYVGKSMLAGHEQERFFLINTYDSKSTAGWPETIKSKGITRNWVALIETIAEALGAFERTADYGRGLTDIERTQKWTFPIHEMNNVFLNAVESAVQRGELNSFLTDLKSNLAILKSSLENSASKSTTEVKVTISTGADNGGAQTTVTNSVKVNEEHLEVDKRAAKRGRAVDRKEEMKAAKKAKKAMEKAEKGGKNGKTKAESKPQSPAKPTSPGKGEIQVIVTKT